MSDERLVGPSGGGEVASRSIKDAEAKVFVDTKQGAVRIVNRIERVASTRGPN